MGQAEAALVLNAAIYGVLHIFLIYGKKLVDYHTSVWFNQFIGAI
jgi:hypothetical protein